MKTFGRGTPYLIAMCDVDGFVSGRSKDTGLSDCGQFLSAQQREQGPLADVHHGSGETQPSPPGRRSQGWRGWGGRDRRGVTRRWEDARRGRGRRCWRWWGAGSRIIPADTDRKKKTDEKVLVNTWNKAEDTDWAAQTSRMNRCKNSQTDELRVTCKTIIAPVLNPCVRHTKVLQLWERLRMPGLSHD